MPPGGPVPLPRVAVDLGDTPADGVPPDTSAADLSVHGLLGEGGMGQVHVAHQRSLHREVAVKTVRQPMDARSAQALCREAVLTGRLEHPGIVPVHAFGQAPDGRPVMIMKRVEGDSWAELLADPDHPAWTESGLPPERLVANLTVLTRVCHAVHFAHDRGFLHRDLKPENVMIGRYGEVYLVDWGLGVRIDDQDDAIGTVVGTPAYMAPEMTIGTEVDQRTDVYLLGAILHELLVGRPPHEGSTLQAVLLAAYDSPTPKLPEDTPAELAQLCIDALQREPKDRVPGAGAFRERVESYLLHRASIALSERATEQLDRVAARFESMVDLKGADPRFVPLREEMDDCRFAFRQALDEWAENPSAIEGTACWADLAVQLEVRAENLAGAEAALALLISPTPERVQEVEALRAEVARVRGEADKHTGATARRRLMLTFAGAGTLLSMVALDLMRRGDSFAPQDTLRIGWGLVALTTVSIVLGRKWVRSSSYNTKFTLLGVIVVASIVLHRHVAVAAGSGVIEILTEDGLILGAMFAVAALTMARWLALCSILFVGGTLLCMAFPQSSPLVFSITSVLGLLIAGAAFGRDAVSSP